MTWTDSQDAEALRGAHLFLHGLDQDEDLIAQGDLYQIEGVRRYQAQTYDGTPLDDNALLIPVQDGFCPAWQWAD
jgi:hypothetical protein